MKKRLIKILVCILVFFSSLYVGTNIMNQGNADMTTTMAKASLPLVHIVNQDITYNTVHGLRQEVDGRFQRGTITPLEDGRTLNLRIEKFDSDISHMYFEVRSIDGSRLVEKTDITTFRENSKYINTIITIKDLIDDNVEYNLILKLAIKQIDGTEETVCYYIRIINAADYYTHEKLTFVSEFHDKTFDKETIKELKTYLEPSSKADNTTLSRVDIHSSLNQVSWGDLDVKQTTPSEITLLDIGVQNASIKISYRVETKVEDEYRTYNVVEYYRIRYTQTRTYLLEFERTMNQVFNPHENVYASNKIMLGIRNENVQMMESDGGSNLAFINEGQLFCYHAADKKMAQLFSFYDGDDPRTIYNNYGIKILNVDETGNVAFIVYGYINRGQHEGNIGIQFYQYNGMMNHIEEQIFIPYQKNYDTLKADIEQLSYMNKSGLLYLYLDGSILAVDHENQIYTEIASQLQQGSFQVSSSDEMLVWQNSSFAYESSKLILMNLNTGKKKEITSSENTRMQPLGFIKEDLIYGVAKCEDILEDTAGVVTFPMYSVYIQNESGDILKNYEHPGAYVVGCEVDNNMITLKRVEKDDKGEGYRAILNDQIINNIQDEKGYNSIEQVATQNYEKIIQIVLKKNIDTKSLKITEPKEVLFEGTRDMELEIPDIERYYVYDKNGVSGTFTRASDAINLAYVNNGIVIDENGNYIWKKEIRKTRNQIMKIKEKSSDDNTSELAVCIETILEYNGRFSSIQKQLDNKKVSDILSEYLPDSKILELKGTSLDAILYYVNQDIPVLAMLKNDKAVLIIGFNELNIVIMDPSTGKIYKKGMNDSKEWLLENGNQFMTYVS